MSVATVKLKAPFPAFGGKSRIADMVWPRLSTDRMPARNYVEPFCFSAAMLLMRPDAPQIETVNDLNSFVANFWRAIQADPEAVAAHADWPVNETDLHSRHAWLVRSHEAAEKLQRVRDEPDYFDAKIAGWWCWGACMWIGSGWCEERGAGWNQIPGVGASLAGVHTQDDKRPQLCNGSTRHGQGVHKEARDVPTAKKPILTSDGGTGDKGVNSVVNLQENGLAVSPGLGNQGIYLRGDGKGNAIARGPSGELHQKRPVFPDGSQFGRGVFGRPQLADAYSRGRGVHGNDSLTDCDRRRLWLINWFTNLADRLRPVRVCCGHWIRVCDSDSTLIRLGTTAVFLDPPYRKKLADGTANRASHIYANDKDQDVEALVDEVQAWCLKWGDNPEIRIAVCGLEGEYPLLDAAGWEKVAWKSQGGYGNRNKDNANAARERIWFSPHCIQAAEEHPLFASMTA